MDEGGASQNQRGLLPPVLQELFADGRGDALFAMRQPFVHPQSVSSRFQLIEFRTRGRLLFSHLRESPSAARFQLREFPNNQLTSRKAPFILKSCDRSRHDSVGFFRRPRKYSDHGQWAKTSRGTMRSAIPRGRIDSGVPGWDDGISGGDARSEGPLAALPLPGQSVRLRLSRSLLATLLLPYEP